MVTTLQDGRMRVIRTLESARYFSVLQSVQSETHPAVYSLGGFTVGSFLVVEAGRQPQSSVEVNTLNSASTPSLDSVAYSLIRYRTSLSLPYSANAPIILPKRPVYDVTWGVQVLRYPNFFLGNGSR